MGILLCEQNFRDVWIRNESVRAEIGQMLHTDTHPHGDCSLVRRFSSPKVRESEIKGSSFRRFCSPKVRKSDNDFYSFLL